MICHFCKDATGMCDMCRTQRSNTAMTMPGDPHARPGAFTDKSDPLNKADLEFIEAMTMPEKIWAGDYSDIDDGGYWWLDEYHNTGLHQYIRADIANDLLTALETIYSQTNDGLARRVAGDSLAHYRALAD